jgi:hypothetical protein
VGGCIRCVQFSSRQGQLISRWAALLICFRLDTLPLAAERFIFHRIFQMAWVGKCFNISCGFQGFKINFSETAPLSNILWARAASASGMHS